MQSLRRTDRATFPSAAADLQGRVESVHCDGRHAFSKHRVDEIRLLAGLGVEGDAHAGSTVQHRSRVAKDPTQPNLRQVHLIQTELHRELAASGFAVSGGQMGENITTEGVDLLALPTGTRLCLGDHALIEITGLRNPCGQLDGLYEGLRAAVVTQDAAGNLIRRAGVMGVVLTGGVVRPGDPIGIELPSRPHLRLRPV